MGRSLANGNKTAHTQSSITLRDMKEDEAQQRVSALVGIINMQPHMFDLPTIPSSRCNGTSHSTVSSRGPGTRQSDTSASTYYDDESTGTSLMSTHRSLKRLGTADSSTQRALSGKSMFYSKSERLLSAASDNRSHKETRLLGYQPLFPSRKALPEEQLINGGPQNSNFPKKRIPKYLHDLRQTLKRRVKAKKKKKMAKKAPEENPISPLLPGEAFSDDEPEMTPRTAKRHEMYKNDKDIPFEMTKWMQLRQKLFKKRISKKKEKRFRQIFNMMDLDGSQSLEVDEVASAMKFVGLHVSTAELIERMKAIDVNYDGEVSYDEFVTGLSTISEWDLLMDLRSNEEKRIKKQMHKLQDKAGRELMYGRDSSQTTAAIAERYEALDRLHRKLDLPFYLWIPAYHRLRVIEGIISEGPSFLMEENHVDVKKKVKWGEPDSDDESDSDGEDVTLNKNHIEDLQKGFRKEPAMNESLGEVSARSISESVTDDEEERLKRNLRMKLKAFNLDVGGGSQQQLQQRKLVYNRQDSGIGSLLDQSLEIPEYATAFFTDDESSDAEESEEEDNEYAGRSGRGKKPTSSNYGTRSHPDVPSISESMASLSGGSSDLGHSSHSSCSSLSSRASSAGRSLPARLKSLRDSPHVSLSSSSLTPHQDESPKTVDQSLSTPKAVIDTSLSPTNSSHSLLTSPSSQSSNAHKGSLRALAERRSSHSSGNPAAPGNSGESTDGNGSAHTTPVSSTRRLRSNPSNRLSSSSASSEKRATYDETIPHELPVLPIEFIPSLRNHRSGNKGQMRAVSESNILTIKKDGGSGDQDDSTSNTVHPIRDRSMSLALASRDVIKAAHRLQNASIGKQGSATGLLSRAEARHGSIALGSGKAAYIPKFSNSSSAKRYSGSVKQINRNRRNSKFLERVGSNKRLSWYSSASSRKGSVCSTHSDGTAHTATSFHEFKKEASRQSSVQLRGSEGKLVPMKVPVAFKKGVKVVSSEGGYDGGVLLSTHWRRTQQECHTRSLTRFRKKLDKSASKVDW